MFIWSDFKQSRGEEEEEKEGGSGNKGERGDKMVVEQRGTIITNMEVFLSGKLSHHNNVIFIVADEQKNETFPHSYILYCHKHQTIHLPS